MADGRPRSGPQHAGAGGDDAAHAVRTATPEETEAVGRALGEAAQRGDVLALVGPLGAGKTAFVRGLATGLGVDPDDVASPTFTMVAEYRGRLPLFHIDLYRLDPGEPDFPTLREYVYGPGITAIEWFDRLPERALDAYLLVQLDYGEPGRTIRFTACGTRATSLLGALTGS